MSSLGQLISNVHSKIRGICRPKLGVCRVRKAGGRKPRATLEGTSSARTVKKKYNKNLPIRGREAVPQQFKCLTMSSRHSGSIPRLPQTERDNGENKKI